MVLVLFATLGRGASFPTPHHSPIAVTVLKPQDAQSGATVQLSVSAMEAGGLDFQWYFDQTNLLVGATNSTLTLSNLVLTGAVNYSVVITPMSLVPSGNVPAITSFNPAAALGGGTVTITGTNFSPGATNDIVYFGAVKAVVKSASTTNLVVTVPTGATYAPITVTVNGLTAYSDSPFLPIFLGSGTLSAASFAGPTNLTAGNGPARVVIGDLDGDGKPDVVVANVYDGSIWIYRNISTNGTLTTTAFAPPVIFTIGGGTDSQYGLALADLTGDGRLDIVTDNRNLNLLSIFQNFSSPGSLTTNSFGARVDIAIPGTPMGLAVGDLDGDGEPDIITANLASDSVSVLRNIYAGGVIASNSFAPPVNFMVGGQPAWVSVADIDGDGKADLVTSDYNSSHTVSILRNVSTAGNIAFASSVDFPGLGSGGSVAAGDLNGDGKLDLVVGSQSTGQAVCIYQNTSTPGNISLAAPVNLPANGWANTVAIGDLDGDGKPDLVATVQLPSHLSVFRNLGVPGAITANSFGLRIDLPAGWNPNGLAIADLDGDGRPDLISGNTYDNTVSIYQNMLQGGGAPVITVQPTNETVQAGGTAMFSVTATGAAPLSYQWSVNGASITNATNSTLALANVQLSQSGNVYWVTVSNGGGLAYSSNVVLTVVSGSNCDPVPLGIVGWWPGEGNADDVVGGNRGTLPNGGSYANGEVGLAFNFDGISQYLLLQPTNGALDIGSGSGFTIEGWIKPTTLSAVGIITEYERVLATGSGSDVGLSFSINNNTTSDQPGCLGVNLVDTNDASHLLASPANVITNGVWQHVALTYDKASGFGRLYVNGQLVAQASLGTFTPQTSFTNVLTARTTFNSVSGPNAPFPGGMDELSFYSRALASNEIAAIYNAGSAGKCQTVLPPVITVQPSNETVQVDGTAMFSVTATGTAPLSYQWSVNGASISNATGSTLALTNVQLSQSGNVYSVTVSNGGGSAYSSNAVLTVNSVSACDPAPSGLIGWWPGEGNADDVVGGNNGALVNASYTNGVVGQAFSFDPENLPYGTYAGVEVPDRPAYMLTNALTIEGWVRPRGNGYMIFFRGDHRPGLDPYSLSMQGNSNLDFFITQADNSFTNVQTTLNYNVWTHVAATFDGTTGTMSLYTNGVLASRLLTSMRPFGTLDASQSPGVGIGNVNDGGNNFPFIGDIDEISLYNRALTPGEIAAIYGAGSAGKCQAMLPPVITVQPANETIRAGGTATFSVTATGTAPLNYQWSVNGAAITNATSSTLVLTNVQLSQSGNVYWVTVSDGGGSTVSSNAMLTVTSVSSCDPVPSGIVSWWPGEGDADDVVGGNNGTLPNGGSYTNGEVGLAFNFNGTSQYLLVQPTNNALDVGLGSGLTVEGWINPVSLSQSMTVVEYERALATGNGSDVGLGIDINNYPNQGISPGCLGVNLVDTNDGSHIIGTAGHLLTNGVWQHVALTYDKASGVGVFYVNGVAVTKTNLGTFTPQTSFTNVLFGGRTTFSSASAPTDQFAGGMDELSVYNRALTSNEISAIYAAGSAGKCTSGSPPVITVQPANQTIRAGGTATFSVTATGAAPLSYQWSVNGASISNATSSTLVLTNVQLSQSGNVYWVTVSDGGGSTVSSNAMLTVTSVSSCDPAPSGIVSWWPGEGNANDIVGTNNGTLQGGVGYLPGKVGMAFNFYDTNAAIYVPASSNLNVGVGAGLTVEAWIKPTDVTQLHPIFEWNSGTNFAVHLFITPSGVLYGNLVDSSMGWHILNSTAGLLVTNQFQHVAMTYDQGSGVATLYCNGQVVAQQNFGSFVPLTTYNLYLGRRPAPAGGTCSFAGLLDEPSIYSRALSSNEIAAIYGAGSAGKCQIAQAPVITVQPTNETIQAGGTATFSVMATGAAPLSYQWSVNGASISNATGSTLTLTNVQLSQSGNIYWVTVSNGGGLAYSSNAVLTVTADPLIKLIPVITAFSPVSGLSGSLVTITGTNFTPFPGSNTVYFGAVKASVKSASSTNLVVTVPYGATFAPITVTVNGLTASANKPFLPTFAGSNSLSSSSLAAGVDIGTGVGPYEVAVGDLDGDGKPDLITLNYSDGTLSVYHNISTNGILAPGSFAPPVVLTVAGAGSSVFGLALADLTGDGRLDILVGDYTLNQISIFQNFSSPGSLTTNSFGAEVDIAIAGQPTGIAVADLDGDGKQDIVTANGGSNTVSVLRNIGSNGVVSASSFAAPVSFATGPAPWKVVVADVDGDGKPDLITVNQSDPNHKVSILRNLSVAVGITTNSFAPAVDLSGADTGEALAVGDIDGDGKLDVVVGSYSGDTLAVYRNVGTPGSITTGSFATPVVFPVGARVHTVAIGDLDGDGKPDLAAVTELPSQLALFKNLSTPGSFSTGSLGPQINFASGNNTAGLVIADLDADGRPDLACGNFYDNTLELYHNLTPIASALLITSQPTNQTISVSGTAVFSVAAAGAAPLNYQWSLNGASIVNATNSTLTVTNVQLSQSGSVYYVTVSNIGGSVVSSNVVLTVVASSVCDTPPSGLVSWWRAEGDASDALGANNGMLENGVSFGVGAVGLAFDFTNGTGYVQVPASGSLNVGSSNGFTIEGWINPASVTTPMAVLEWNGNNGTAAIGPILWISAPYSSAGFGNVVANIGDTSGNSHTFYTADGLINSNTFQHVALTYDKTTGLAAIYVNGALVKSQNLGIFTPQTTYPLYFGIRISDTSEYQFRGEIDEMSLYSRALTQNEILAVYGAGGAGKCQASIPPVITLQPTNETIRAGATATFSVSARGTAPLGYQWVWSGSNVISGATNATLTITNVQTGNTGFYSVTVSNLYGTATSSNAFLSVADAMDHFVWSPIPSPRFVNAKFPVTVKALDAVNNVFTNFTGKVFLGSTNGVPVNPPVSANFVQGLWSGSLSFSQPASNLVLSADDGTGQVGMANAIAVVNPPSLETAQSDGQLVFVWPVASSNFVLETTSKLSPANWVPVAVSPVQIGDQNLVLLPAASTTNGFYHLRFTGQ
jgi:RecA/RadA recombinase